eukprot:SAG22_NODE_1155_length_5341_cov_12.348531_3_plen_66_part_00
MSSPALGGNSNTSSKTHEICVGAWEATRGLHMSSDPSMDVFRARPEHMDIPGCSCVIGIQFPGDL